MNAIVILALVQLGAKTAECFPQETTILIPTSCSGVSCNILWPSESKFGHLGAFKYYWLTHL